MARPVSHVRAPLIAPLSSFIGREQEIAAIVNLLRQPGVRLVTLTGPGGVGKTRLALQIADRLQREFADGSAAVSLAPVVDASLVLSVIAQTLGISPAPDRSFEEALADLLLNREQLLLLDNFEHLVGAGRDIAALLAACPTLKVLVTSRAVLRLSGEHDVAVGPLQLPTEVTGPSTASIAAAPAVRLFVDRARAARSDFALTGTNAIVIAEICRRLDGLPLAIELAAARVAHLPVESMLERLDPSLPVLTGGARDQPTRQQTMRDTIAWSYDLLSPEDQFLFRRLAAFVGGFTLDAAEAVAATDGPDVLAGISSLIDKSLVRQAPEAGQVPRYFMLETIREFALEQLAGNGEAALASARHAAYFKTLTENVTASFYWGDDQDRLAQITDDLPNLRSAATWALTNDQAELALHFGLATVTLLISSNPQDGLRWFEAILDVPDLDPLVRSDALCVAATLWVLTDTHRATMLATESRAIAAAHGDRLREARALDQVAISAEWSGEFDLATKFHTEGLAILGELPDDEEIRGLRAWFKCNIADEHLWRNNPELARPLADAALTWWRQTGMQWAIPFALQTLGAASSMQGDQQAASTFYGEALTLRNEHGDLWGTAGILDGIAGVAVGIGKRHEAVVLLGAASAARARLGVKRGPHWLRGKQVREAVKSQMTATNFAAAWDTGEALTHHQAIEEARRVLDDAQTPGGASPVGLTPREHEVLTLIVAGLSNTEIGDRLFISTRTAQTHVTNILGKLCVSTRTEAAAKAVRDGLA